MSRRLFAAAPVLMLLAGCATSSGQPRGSDSTAPTSPSASSGRTSAPEPPGRGPGLGASAALARALHGIDPGALRDARVGPNPPGYGKGRWLYATGHCTSAARGGCLPAAWEGDLVAGGTAQWMRTNERSLTRLIEGSTVRLRPAEREVEGGRFGDNGALQRYRGTDRSDAALAADVRRTCASFKVRVIQLRILHPFAPALYLQVALTLATTHRFTLGALSSTVLGNPRIYEGAYVELRTAQGKIIGRTATDWDTVSGRLWSDPAYGDVIGIAHG